MHMNTKLTLFLLEKTSEIRGTVVDEQRNILHMLATETFFHKSSLKVLKRLSQTHKPELIKLAKEEASEG